MRRNFKKGTWVRYGGPNPVNVAGDLTKANVGTVAGTSGGLVTVHFIIGDRTYGCYPEFLTPMSKVDAAREVARLALGVGK